MNLDNFGYHYFYYEYNVCIKLNHIKKKKIFATAYDYVSNLLINVNRSTKKKESTNKRMSSAFRNVHSKETLTSLTDNTVCLYAIKRNPQTVKKWM